MIFFSKVLNILLAVSLFALPMLPGKCCCTGATVCCCSTIPTEEQGCCCSGESDAMTCCSGSEGLLNGDQDCLCAIGSPFEATKSDQQQRSSDSSDCDQRYEIYSCRPESKKRIPCSGFWPKSSNNIRQSILSVWLN